MAADTRPGTKTQLFKFQTHHSCPRLMPCLSFSQERIQGFSLWGWSCWLRPWMIDSLWHWICLKGALDKFNIIPTFSRKVGIFIPLEVLAWVMTACRVLRSRLTYFWRYMNISSIFYFSKSTSINTQYSSLWDTLKMMLFTKYLIKWKRSLASRLLVILKSLNTNRIQVQAQLSHTRPI